MNSLTNRNYCTLFDSNYLPQGRAMIESLLFYDRRAVIYVLCIDDGVYTTLLKNNNSDKLILIPLNELEKHNSDLVNSKNNRSKVEYYWTCGPAFLLYVFENNINVNLLTYLDADLYFYSTPDTIYNQIGSRSIAIVPHNFTLSARRLLKYGYYNVSWVSFRRDEEGLTCLKHWHLDCVEFCGDWLDDKGRYGDQKYLDNWTNQYRNVCVLDLPGVNLAIWNVGRYVLSRDKQRIVINKKHPLVFYHFSGLKMINNNYFITNVSRYFTFLTYCVKTDIYLPYIKKLMEFGYLDRQKEFISLRRDNNTLNGTGKRILRFIFRDRISIS